MGSGSIRRSGAPALALLALAACKSMPRDLAVTATGSYWMPEPDGHVTIGAGSQPGSATHADLEHDLGIDDDAQWTGRVDASFGKHRFGVEYLPFDLGGSGVTGGFTFQGAAYPAGDAISSDLELTTWVARWDYQLESRKRTEDSLRIGLDAWWWGFDSRVRGIVSGNDEARSFTRLYPGAHVDLRFDLNRGLLLDVAAAVAGTGYHRHLLDLSGALGWRFSDSGHLAAGYRWIEWDFDHGNDHGNFGLLGPFAALTFRF